MSKTSVVKLSALPPLSELAKKSGLAVSTLSRIFTSDPTQQRWPRSETLDRIASALGLPRNDVLTLIDLERKANAKRRKQN